MSITQILSKPNSWVINLSLPETTSPINPELAYWNGTDRFWAIAGGYMSLTAGAALYLRRGFLSLQVQLRRSGKHQS